jgi:2-oxoglutarate ferredoxin oxidoreductase subunit alpha
MKEKFMKGCHALGEALVRAGCRCYFGYPITPSSDLLEYLSWRMFQEPDGVFMQAESELAAINMIYGAAATGKRTATGSSGPGISLMQEGLSYLAAAELPCVIINISRDGPGLGGISSSQGDYFQATRGGGHGDYRTIALAPATVQEMVDLVPTAFELAEKYRTPVVILADAMLGQMYESVRMPPPVGEIPEKPWAVTGAANRPRNKVPEFFGGGEEFNLKLREKYQRIGEQETRFELFGDRRDDLLIVAFGTTARVCKSVVQEASQERIRVGLFRPVTLYPFPYEALKGLAQKAKRVLVAEMSLGQMIDDVKIAVGGSKDIDFFSRVGGLVPTRKEIMAWVHEITDKEAS